MLVGGQQGVSIWSCLTLMYYCVPHHQMHVSDALLTQTDDE